MKSTGKFPVSTGKPPGIVSLATSHRNQPKLSSVDGRQETLQKAGPLLGWSSSNMTNRYSPHPKAKTTYSLLDFYATRSKEIHRVADQSLILSCTTLFSPCLTTSASLLTQTGSGSTIMTISKGLRVISTRTCYEDTFGTRVQKISTRSSHPMKQSHRAFSHDGEHKTPYRFNSNPGIANLVNEELTKAETMTIRHIFAYIKLESAKINKRLR
ncbi:hypothetical protein Bca4012_063379 [Brassica carinata]|uniref:Uncharacterized protein n=1 Tax=Brassica carinata TaxID=52824 RepID=A0A8X7SC42_BRACI|nr:hypothetical protein Bca52824_033035 [Brassica carinata]